MSGGQTTLGGDSLAAPDHLTKRPPAGSNWSQNELGEREWVCKTCMARVTQSADRSCEWGHRRRSEDSRADTCPHYAHGGDR